MLRYRVAEKPFCLYYFVMLIEGRKRIVNSIIRNERGKIAALPYALTWSRLPLAVAFYIAVTSDSPLLAVLFLILVGLSDFLDGYFARKYIGHGTAYGPVLDPIVDKTFVLIAVWGLHKAGVLEWHQILFLLFRDVFTTVLIISCHPWIRRRMQIKSRPLGKAVTNLQFATILAALVLVIFPHLTRRPVEWLSILTLVISVFSIMDYVYTYLRGGIDRR